MERLVLVAAFADAGNRNAAMKAGATRRIGLRKRTTMFSSAERWVYSLITAARTGDHNLFRTFAVSMTYSASIRLAPH
jgi:hypothetical protein